MADDSGLRAYAVSECEQLLYTNVDHVIDGVERSGWQTMVQTPGLSEDDASTLYALIDPSLSPITPLSGFPTAQEVAAADRRLVQFPTNDGLVLVHTAPAGNDTTGRPNTMSHVVLLRGHEPAPGLRTIDLWRSAGWVTPFGPEQVRQAELPAPERLQPGECVDDDTVAEFVSNGSRGAVLMALADALEARLIRAAHARRGGSPAEAVKGSTVVLAVSSTDEAALWIGALLRTCAPATGRYLSYSVLQRIMTTSDAEMLLQSRIDIACVPRQDLENVGRPLEGLVVIDPQEITDASEVSPTTSWGRLVALMTQDMGAWVAAYEGVNDLLSLLDDHSDLTPGWPLAAAEACDPGLLGYPASVSHRPSEESEAQPGPRGELIEIELVSCYPRSLVGNDYLTAVVTDCVLDSSTRDAASWYERLSRIPPWAPANGLVGGLCERYLETACDEVPWLTDLERPVAEQASRCLREWSGMREHRAQVDTALAHAQELVEAEIPGITGGLRILDRMIRDHVNVSTAAFKQLLRGCADVMLPGANGSVEQDAILAVPATSLSRSLLADEVDQQLVREEYSGGMRVLPSLSRKVLDWLNHDNEPGNRVQIEAQIALTALAAGGGDVRRACLALGRLGGVFSLQPAVVQALAHQAQPDMLQHLPQSCQNFHEIFAEVLIRHHATQAAIVAARSYLGSCGLPERGFTARSIARLPPAAAMGLVVTSRVAPLMTQVGPSEAMTYAGNVLVAIRALATQRRYLRCDPVRQAMAKAMGVLLAGVWAGTSINLERSVLRGNGPEIMSTDQALALALEELPETLGRHPEYLVAEGERGLGPLVPAIVPGLYFSSGVRIPANTEAVADQVLDHLKRAVRGSSTMFWNRRDAAMAVVRAVIAHLDAEQRESSRSVLHSLFDDNAGARRWVDKKLLSAAGRGSGNRLRVRK